MGFGWQPGRISGKGESIEAFIWKIRSSSYSMSVLNEKLYIVQHAGYNFAFFKI